MTLPELPHHEKAIKLLHSCQGAFSVQKDPWTDLMHGIGLTAAELEKVWLSIIENGIIEGITVQIDPSAPEFQEYLVPLNSDEIAGIQRSLLKSDIIRMASVVCMKNEQPDYLEYAWPAEQWIKVGTFYDLNEGANSVDELMKPMTERSWFVQESRYQSLPFNEDMLDQIRILTANPVKLRTSEPIWKTIGDALNITNLDVVREDISKLLLSRRARRFHLKTQPENTGYPAKALIGWQIPSDQAPNAGRALGSIRATSDVCIRKPTQKFPANLSAFVHAAEQKDLKEIRDRIAKKWNIEPTVWFENNPA